MKMLSGGGGRFNTEITEDTEKNAGEERQIENSECETQYAQ